MNDEIKRRLIVGLDKLFEDCHVKISAKYIHAQGLDGLEAAETINQCFKDWEQAGLLRIMKPYQDCQPEDICIKMLNFIDCGPPHDRFWENPHLIKQMHED
jgi:hypothetical protein